MDGFRTNLMKKFLSLILFLSFYLVGFSQADKDIFGTLTVTDTIITDKGYKFPDGSFQNTAGNGAVNVSDSLKAGVTDSLLINTNALVVKTTGQIGIGIASPDASSLLDITSITRGFLYPRMTTAQRDAIGSPVTGLSVYNLTNNDPNFFDGSDWRRITHAPSSSLKVGEVIFATGVSALMGDSINFFWDNTSKRLGIGTGGPSEKLEVSGNIKSDTIKTDVLKLNGINADSIIGLDQVTGNLANLTTGLDTIFSNVIISNLYNYGTDTGSTDSYKIPIPSITTYTTGLKITFLTVTANTDGATVTINGLAAKTLKKLRDQDVVTGDIEASQIIVAVYDGVNWQIISQLAQ